MGKVRIIGGFHRSRILNFKDGVNGLRPTSDRVRETLFNWLGQDLSSKYCLDLFAGSGALGFEALSRNAKHVIMVESNKQAIFDLQQNKKILNITNAEIIQQNALSYLTTNSQLFDVIFLDPPYGSDLLESCLAIISKSNVLASNGIIYIEYQNIPSFNGYSVVKSNKAGIAHYALLRKEE